MANDKTGANGADDETKIPRDALDDDVFAQLMEEEFEKAKSKNGATGAADATGANDAASDAQMQTRIWENLQKKIAVTDAGVKPAAHRASTAHSATIATPVMRENAQSAPSARSVTRTKTVWSIAAGVIGLAAAVLFFLRVGPAQDAGESDPLNPSNLKGAIETARISLEVTRDASTGSVIVSVRGDDASVQHGAVFLASEGGEAQLVARGIFAATDASPETRPLQTNSKGGFFKLSAEQTGRVCLFISPTSEKLEEIEKIVASTPTVFAQQAPKMCQDFPLRSSPH